MKINWDELRAAWERDEIRRGNNVQMSLLTDAPIRGTLVEQLSLDREPTSHPEPFQQRVERQETGGSSTATRKE